MTFDAKTQQVRLIAHKIFQPSPNCPLDFEQAIEGTLLDLKKRFYIKRILYDPWQMAATAQRMLRAQLPIEEFPQTQPNLTAASQNLYELIQGQNLHVYADGGPMRSIRHLKGCCSRDPARISHRQRKTDRTKLTS